MESFLNAIQHIEETYGPRIAGTEADQQAIKYIEEKFGSFSETVETQSFNVVGRALQYLIQFLVWGYFISVLSYILLAPLALGFAVCMLIIYYLARFQDLNLVNLFVKKEATKNVIARFEPKQEKKAVLIFSGHHDSAFHMPLFDKSMRTITFVQNSALLGIVMLVLSAIWKTIILFVPATGIIGTGIIIGDVTLTSIYLLPDLIFFLAVIGLIPAFYFLKNMVTDTPLIGANDNLTSIAMLFALGEYFSKNPPENIEVRLASFGAEEPGLVGSSKYVKERLSKQKKVININFETLGCGKLGVIEKEKDNNITHDVKLINFIQKTGKKLDLNLQAIKIRYGNTDAGSFSKKGYSATTIFGYGKDYCFDLWHSLDDKTENLSENIMNQAYKLAIEIYQKLEENQIPNL